MTTKINPDFKPSRRVSELLAIRYGLTTERAAEFIGQELAGFLMYWMETGKAKASWNSTCLNWMDRNYEHKKEAIDRNHQRSKNQGNIFDQTLNKLTGEEEEKPIRTAYRFIPHEPTTETMSTEDALAELRRITRVAL